MILTFKETSRGLKKKKKTGPKETFYLSIPLLTVGHSNLPLLRQEFSGRQY